MAGLVALAVFSCRPESPVVPPPPPAPEENHVRIEPDPVKTGSHVAKLEMQEDSSWLIVLPASDPYIYFLPLEEALPAENTVLAFEYRAEYPIDKTQCFFLDAVDGLNAAHAQDGPGADASDEAPSRAASSFEAISGRPASGARSSDVSSPGRISGSAGRDSGAGAPGITGVAARSSSLRSGSIFSDTGEPSMEEKP